MKSCSVIAFTYMFKGEHTKKTTHIICSILQLRHAYLSLYCQIFNVNIVWIHYNYYSLEHINIIVGKKGRKMCICYVGGAYYGYSWWVVRLKIGMRSLYVNTTHLLGFFFYLFSNFIFAFCIVGGGCLKWKYF